MERQRDIVAVQSVLAFVPQLMTVNSQSRLLHVDTYLQDFFTVTFLLELAN